ncbi:MAG: ATP-binding protein [Sandaracinaceae bacterium]
MSAADAFRQVEGQSAATDVLAHAVDNDRVASSYLFEGPSGVGKQRSALALAKVVLGADEATQKRIDGGSHPDVRVFLPREDGKRNIQVDTLRQQILPIAQFAPFEARAAFLIFPEADVSFPELPPESANALLKTLEEPRANVHFILLSERPDRLLPTIRSRCQRVRFARLSSELLRRVLSEHDVPEDAREAAIALADGRADRALVLAEGQATALLDMALEVDEACTVGGPGTLVRVSERLVRGELPLRTVFDALIAFYRDVAAAGLGLPDDMLAFRHRAADIRARATRVNPTRASDRVAQIGQAQIALERNGNPQVVVDALLYGARV